MNFHSYLSMDVVNGPGVRCTLFVSGCEHKCPGCYNATTWSLTSGELFTQSHEDKILTDLSDLRIKRQGLSLTGGDPLHPNNLASIEKLVARVSKECSDKDIWCWSGYTYSELSREQRKVLKYLNVLIDGKYVQDRKRPNLAWRGSDNQKVLFL